MSEAIPPHGGVVPDTSLLTYTHVVYALHALSVVMGVTGAASIAGSFVFGLPSIVAVIMNYARRAEARDTFLASHFIWQIRTFWWALGWSVLAFVLSLPFMLIVIGFITFALALIPIGIWVTYRVLRGWLALRDGRPMYA